MEDRSPVLDNCLLEPSEPVCPTETSKKGICSWLYQEVIVGTISDCKELKLRFWVQCTVIFFNVSVLYTSLNYFPFFFEEKYGLSDADSGIAASLVYWCCLAAGIWGAMFDKTGYRLLGQVVAGAFAGAGFMAYYFLPSSFSPYPIAVLIGISFALIETNAYTLLLNMVHEGRLIGTGAGLLGTSLNIALVVMPLLVSASYDHFNSYKEQNLIFAAFLLISIGLSIWLIAMDGPKCGDKERDLGCAGCWLTNPRAVVVAGADVAAEDHNAKPASRCFVVSVSMLIGFTAASGYYAFHLPGAIESQMKDDEDWSVTELSWLFTIYSLPNLVAPLLMGRCLTVFGHKPCFLVCLLATTIGVVVFNVACDFDNHQMRFILSLVGRALLGFGSESAILCYQAIVEYWFSSNHLALAMGVAVGMVQCGGSAVTFVFGPIFAKSGLSFCRWTAAMYCGLSFLAFVAYYFVELANKDYLEGPSTSASRWTKLRNVVIAKTHLKSGAFRGAAASPRLPNPNPTLAT